MPQNMKFLRKAAVAALIAASFGASPALAAPEGTLDSMSLELGAGIFGGVHVKSSNGSSWTGIEETDVSLSGAVKIKLKHGLIKGFGVYLGTCSGHACFEQVGTPLLGAIHVDPPYVKSIDGTTSLSFSSLKLGDPGSPGIALVPFGSEIVARCNAGLNEGKSINQGFGFTHTVQMTLGADTRMWDAFTFGSAGNNFVLENEPLNDVDFEKTVNVEIPVVCEPVPIPPSTGAPGQVGVDFGDFDVKNVKLFLTTTQPGQPGSTPGTVCPGLKVTSRAQTNQAGPVSMRIWRRKDGGPITSEFTQAWASYDAAKNGYFASYEKWENVGATAYFQYKTEIVEDDPFPPFDGWKDIAVNCTGAGGGGLAPNPVPNPDVLMPQANWQGELTIADSAGHDKSCPRKGQVFFSVHRAEPGDFHYRVSCSNGAFFTGTATGYTQGSGIFEAYGAHDLNITKTRSVQCTLQELQPAPVTVATDEEDFTCVKRLIDPASEDLVIDTRPTIDKPEPKPLVIVDPAPKCLRSQRLVRGKCFDKPIVAACRNDEQLLNGRCVKIPTDPPLCQPGYRLVGKRCVRKPVIVAKCDRDEQLLNGRCVKIPTDPILCKKGFTLRGKICVRIPTVTTHCKRGEKLVRGNCIAHKPPARIKSFVAPRRPINKDVLTKTPARPQAGKLRRLQ